MYVDVLLGLQWGDEGKGKIVDYLAHDYDYVARFQGGPNAGHTLKINGESFVLHTIPSGVFHEGVGNIIGNGVVIDPITFKKEIDKLIALGVDVHEKIMIAKKAHLILPTHKALDAASEVRKGKAKIGSTLRGIGPTFMDKTGRNGLRVGDLLSPNFQEKYDALKAKHEDILRSYNYDFDASELEEEWMTGADVIRSMKTIDCEYFINEELAKGKKVLAEGAQGMMLDIDFGTYPFVTSSNTMTAGACTGLGIAPSKIREVIGISKAYCTRVGSGPFPTELDNEEGEYLRKEGGEFGATTGRPRRCGWIDLPALKYAKHITGLTQLVVTKVDVLNSFESFKACVAYEIDGQTTEALPYDICDVEITPVNKEFKGWTKEIKAQNFDELPTEVSDFILYLEEYLGVPVTIVSNGPGRDELILKEQVMPA